MADVFISYAREDIAFVQDLRRGLGECDHDAWVDLEGIYAGEEFWPTICSAIEGSDAFVFVISPESVTSQYCRREIEHAVTLNKRIVPILRREVDTDAIPKPAADRQWIFLGDNADFDDGIRSILEAIDTDVNWVRAHTRLLVRSREWDNNERDNSYLLRGGDLNEAEEWLTQGAAMEPEPTPLQIQFITASRRAATRRQRVMLGAVTSGLIVAIVLALVAFHQRQTAVRERRIAEARLLENQGQEVFEDQPLLGLRLLIEGWALMPADAVDGRKSISNSIQALTRHGRLAKLGNDIGSASWSTDASRFLLDRRKSPDELRQTVDGKVIATFAREVDKAEFIATPDPGYLVTYHAEKPRVAAELRRISDGTIVPLRRDAEKLFFSPQADFVVVDNHGTVSDELRRTADGALIASLDAPLSRAFFPPSKPVRTVILDYYGSPDEVRRTDDGRILTTLAGEVVDIRFSPGPAPKQFIVAYSGAPGELRRSRDGAAVATLAGRSIGSQFSPDGKYVLVRYADTADELRRSDDGRVVVSLKKVNGVDFSPDATYFVVDYGSTLPGELRRTSDGTVVANLPHPVAAARFSADPNVKTFLADYYREADELRRIMDGGLVWSSREAEQIFVNPHLTHFIVQYPHKPGELHHVDDGSLAQVLTDVVERVYFSPSGRSLVINYSSGVRATVVQAELRRADTGEIIATLRDSVAKVHFSSDPEAAFFVADYNVGSDVLHSTIDGSVIAVFSGEVDKVDFKPDAGAFVIGYADGRSEVWHGSEAPRVLSDLGLGKKGHFFDHVGQRLMLWHTDGRAYLLDLAWLKAVVGESEALEPEELVQLTCRGPLSSGRFDEDAVKKYIGHRAPLSCR